jgi:tellurite resistance protein
MLALVGSRVCYRTIGHGVFHCERCGGDRPYRHRSGRRWAHLLGIPIVLIEDTGEHLSCTVCRTCYRTELLAVPTIEQMLVALLAGTKAAVVAMLHAGGAGNPAARQRGIALIKSAGAPDYHDGRMLAALEGAKPGQALPGCEDEAVPGLRPAVEAVAIQLDTHAKEWFLAKMVEVGLADGPLSDAERAVARTTARHLGMTAAHGRDVISLTEEAAQA